MTAYSGLWDGVHGETYALQTDKHPIRKRVSVHMRRSRIGLRILNELLDSTIGAAAGGAAAASVSRVEAIQQLGDIGYGGAVSIESRTLINRVTTAADIADLKTIFSEQKDANAYPTDASGNGGGGKVGI